VKRQKLFFLSLVAVSALGLIASSRFLYRSYSAPAPSAADQSAQYEDIHPLPIPIAEAQRSMDKEDGHRDSGKPPSLEPAAGAPPPRTAAGSAAAESGEFGTEGSFTILPASALTRLDPRVEAHEAMIQRMDGVLAEYGKRLQEIEKGLETISSPASAKQAVLTVKPKIRKPKNRVPPKAMISKLAEPKRRRQADAEAPLSFSVESVDTWNGEKRVVLRQGATIFDKKIGDAHDGWRIDSTDGQSVTLRGPKGEYRHVDAAGETP
jgi:hypothetical protein